MLKSLIVRYGAPETIVSDNGAGFTSQDFKKPMKSSIMKWTSRKICWCYEIIITEIEDISWNNRTLIKCIFIQLQMSSIHNYYRFAIKVIFK